MSAKDSNRIDVNKPPFDTSTFAGRFKYFAWMTDPRTGFVTTKNLMKAKELVEQYRLKKEPAGTTQEEIKYAMKLYTSAFHPDTGELQNFAGRMSFQVPGGMLLTGAMLQFYRTVPAVVFWQFANQSFNAIVNYTNRNAKSPTSVMQLGISYVSATTSALVAALGCKSYWSKKASPILQRYVPFAAVAAANCVNIPMMRQNEIIKGVDVQDEKGKIIGQSRVAAIKGISEVIFSRVTMAAPGMLVLPIIMERLEKIPSFKRMTVLHAPFQTLACGLSLLLMVPLACALFPQQCSLNTSTMKLIEPKFYDELVKKTGGDVPKKVYFNKGL